MQAEFSFGAVTLVVTDEARAYVARPQDFAGELPWHSEFYEATSERNAPGVITEREPPMRFAAE